RFLASVQPSSQQGPHASHGYLDRSAIGHPFVEFGRTRCVFETRTSPDVILALCHHLLSFFLAVVRKVYVYCKATRHTTSAGEPKLGYSGCTPFCPAACRVAMFGDGSHTKFAPLSYVVFSSRMRRNVNT